MWRHACSTPGEERNCSSSAEAAAAVAGDWGQGARVQGVTTLAGIAVCPRWGAAKGKETSCWCKRQWLGAGAACFGAS